MNRRALIALLVGVPAARIARRRFALPASLAPLPERVRTAVVIPALNEAEALADLLPAVIASGVDSVIVVDGGSTDLTTSVAIDAGARVLMETRRGYGQACAAGAAATDAEIIVFMDGDGSDDPAEIARVLEPVRAGRVALCLGARDPSEPGAMTGPQRVGSRAVAALVRLTYGVRVTDVPSLRAIRADVLATLDMCEMTYGWPTEMIVKAARAGVGIEEVRVNYRERRGGVSKVAGQFGPSVRAGVKMLAVAVRA